MHLGAMLPIVRFGQISSVCSSAVRFLEHTTFSKTKTDLKNVFFREKLTLDTQGGRKEVHEAPHGVHTAECEFSDLLN